MTTRTRTRWSVMLMIGLSVTLVGCGTVNSRITSTPSGARVCSNGRYVGTTPLTLPLKDGLGQDAYVISVEEKGFKPQSVEFREQRFSRFDLPSKWIPFTLDFVLVPEDNAGK
jgi:hypothetical protein